LAPVAQLRSAGWRRPLPRVLDPRGAAAGIADVGRSGWSLRRRHRSGDRRRRAEEL